MSIYTDNEDRLCCPLCGSTAVALHAVDLPDDMHTVTLTGGCRACRGEFDFRFVTDGATTLVGSARRSTDAPGQASARAYWLDEIPGQRTDPARSGGAR